MGLTDLDPYRFPAALVDDVPEPTHTTRGAVEPDIVPLPASEPDSRVFSSLAPVDRRRLDLHAALTVAGVTPRPGDLDAIEALCRLDDTTHAALRRWISRTT
ncbi:hypothetical protein ACF1E9_12510 [Streptomyces roseolus]|uniref:hypothetical protein n=1 Tax=Streptomyces TaxID=1883 RepID=UPI0036F0187A